jgi:hypothetical protein
MYVDNEEKKITGHFTVTHKNTVCTVAYSSQGATNLLTLTILNMIVDIKF